MRGSTVSRASGSKCAGHSDPRDRAESGSTGAAEGDTGPRRRPSGVWLQIAGLWIFIAATTVAIVAGLRIFVR